MHRADVEELRKQAIEQLQNSVLGFFPTSHLTRDGRVAAKQPGINASPDDRIRWWMTYMWYNNHVNASIHAIIGPALEVLLLEHRLQEADFVNLAEQSPFVEMTGRERLLGKALYAGYDLNFATALHILVPQLEHLVRFHLKERGVSTTNLNENGETEIGLSALMDRPETEEIFGKDLRFEIQALFCDPVGANLRNNVAHGLIGYEECHRSHHAIYAWWLVLKIVFNTFWNARHSSPESDKPQEE